MAIDVEFRNVSKNYGQVSAVKSVDLAVASGSFLALLGPSGCGKTTCLRLIGGFEQPTAGEVFIRGEPMAGVAAYNRPVNMVFQHYALFPHLNVGRNVAYGLRQVRPRLGNPEIERRVAEALEMVHLGGYGHRRIFELSGGQQQRVALARALINKPAVLLLDEPLAALDKKLRIAMQIELQSLQRDLGITFVLVTHDQEEALSMSDMVCVMNEGRIVQFGKPTDVYDEPADLFVADFVGKANMLHADVVEIEDGVVSARLASGSVLSASAAARRGTALARGSAVTISVRPEALRIQRASADAGNAVNSLNGTVTNRIFLGSTAEYAIQVAGVGNILATADHQARVVTDLFEPGESVCVTFSRAAALAFAAKPTNPPAVPATQGESGHVQV